MNNDYSNLKPKYQRWFKEFDEMKGTKTIIWNGKAFFFHFIWAMTKGCTKNGVLWLVICAATFTWFPGIFAVICIYYGCRGNWLFYKKFKENKDIWI